VRKALDPEPAHPVALYAAGVTQVRLGQDDEAVAVLERAVEIAGRATFQLGVLGAAYGLTGRTEGAQQVLEELEQRGNTEYVAPLCLAWVLAGLGQIDPAFERLEAAHEDRNGFLVLPGFPPFDSLRSDPRFEQFFGRMGLRG